MTWSKHLTRFKGTLTNSSSFALRQEQFFFWSKMSRSSPEVEVPGDQRLVKMRLSRSVVERADATEHYLVLLGCLSDVKP